MLLVLAIVAVIGGGGTPLLVIGGCALVSLSGLASISYKIRRADRDRQG
jgi:hypothetical protein